MLDVHAAALEAVDESLHSFLLRYRSVGTIVYGFVEGKEDPMYYRNLIERFLPDAWTVDLIRAGNKAKVKRCFDEMDWGRFDRDRIAFFIDADLDFIFRPEVLPVGSNVYETDGYSIENSLVDERMFMRMLVEAFNVADLSSDEEDKLKAAFGEDLKAFQQHLMPIMAMILHWRSNAIQANLSDLDLRKMFGFQDGRMIVKEGMDDPNARLDLAASSIRAPKPTAEELKASEESIMANGGEARLTRGKYLLWFFAHALEHYHQEISRYSASYRTPPKPKATIGPANVMFHSAPRARCPTSLRCFIEQTYLRYIDRIAA